MLFVLFIYFPDVYLNVNIKSISLDKRWPQQKRGFIYLFLLIFSIYLKKIFSGWLHISPCFWDWCPLRIFIIKTLKWIWNKEETPLAVIHTPRPEHHPRFPILIISDVYIWRIDRFKGEVCHFSRHLRGETRTRSHPLCWRQTREFPFKVLKKKGTALFCLEAGLISGPEISPSFPHKKALNEEN